MGAVGNADGRGVELECIFRRFRPPIPGQSDQVPERVDAGVLLGLKVVGLRRRRCRHPTAHERVHPERSGRQHALTQCTTVT